MSYISFPVFRISLDIKWAHKSGYQVGINYTLNKQKEKKESCYFSHFLLKKKKNRSGWSLAFAESWISLHKEGLDFCQMSFSRMHIRLAEVQLSLSCSKGQVSREIPASHPQPTPNFMQFLFAFLWPAIPILSLHKNSTLWHLMNKIIPWPEYTFGRGTQRTFNCPCTQISSRGQAPFHFCANH